MPRTESGLGPKAGNRQTIDHFTSLHFVVLQPPCTDTITYWDPIDRQDHSVPRDDFAARWSGYLMMVEGPWR